MKSVRRVSVLIIIFCLIYLVNLYGGGQFDVVVQNRIIDDIFVTGNYFDYLGYIEIPKFGIRRLIKYGTDSDILDDLYVGLYELSSDIDSDDLIILAGHNVSNVFSSLHNILIGDYVYIVSPNGFRRFIVYDKKVVSDDDFSYFDNRKNEMLLITCDKTGYRLFVFLEEDI